MGEGNGVCSRCGQCCLAIDGEGNIVPCQYYSGGDCPVYDERIGKSCGVLGYSCTQRSGSSHDFHGCPQNTDKPIRDWRQVVERLRS